MRFVKASDIYLESWFSNMKRKIIALGLCLCMVFGLTACGKTDGVVTKAIGSTNYEFDENLTPIEVDKSVKDFYENQEWNIETAFDNLAETVTYVDDEDQKYTLKATIDNDNDFKVIFEAEDDDKNTLSAESRIVGNKAYLKVSSNMMEKDAFFVSDYDIETSALYTPWYCEVFDLAKSMGAIGVDKENVDITYNCRTELDTGVVVDVITLMFYENMDNTYVLYVDSETHKVLKITSTLISGNDSTELIYFDVEDFVIDFTDAELKNSIQGEAVEITDDVMAELFDIVVYAIYDRNTTDLSELEANESVSDNEVNTETNIEESEVE